MSTCDTSSASPTLLKRYASPSSGSISLICSQGAWSRSRSVFSYSYRFNRLHGARPAVAARVRSAAIIGSSILLRNACSAEAFGRGIPFGGISPSRARSWTFTHSAKVLGSFRLKPSSVRSSPPLFVWGPWQGWHVFCKKAVSGPVAKASPLRMVRSANNTDKLGLVYPSHTFFLCGKNTSKRISPSIGASGGASALRTIAAQVLNRHRVVPANICYSDAQNRCQSLAMLRARRVVASDDHSYYPPVQPGLGDEFALADPVDFHVMCDRLHYMGDSITPQKPRRTANCVSRGSGGFLRLPNKAPVLSDLPHPVRSVPK